MLHIGISLVVGGGLGLCLSKAIMGKAAIVLGQAMHEEGWKKTAFKLAGYGLLALSMLTIIGSIGAITAVCGVMIGFTLSLFLPPGTEEIAFFAGIIFTSYFGRDYIAGLQFRFAEWMNFSELDVVT